MNARPLSLRRYLLLGILLPVLLLIALNGVSLYRRALAAVNTAYDRTLLASAKVIGEQLDVDGFDDEPSRTEQESYGYVHSRWVALSRSPAKLESRLAEVGGEWQPVSPASGEQLWTDDRASVLGLLK